MWRWIGAVGVLLAGAFTTAQADYIKLIYNPTLSAGLTGGGGGFGPGGMPAGAGTSTPPGGGSPFGGAAGAGTSTPPGGGSPFGRPAGGGTSTPGGGFPGGGMPGGGFGPGAGQPGMTGDEDIESSLLGEAVVEVKEVNQQLKLKGILAIKTKFGKGWVTLSETQDIKVLPITLPTVAQRYKAERGADDKKSPEEWMRLADWALRHGLLDDFAQDMEQLKKVDAGNRSAAAFAEVQAAMAKPAAKNDDVALWKDRLGNYQELTSAHYSLLYKPERMAEAEARDFLTLLENNYRAFFSWYALKGKVVPPPARRLVAVLVPQADEFRLQAEVFDSPTLAADGFFDRRDDLGVFSAEPLNPAYDALNNTAKTFWTSGWDKAKVLNGQVRPDVPLAETSRVQLTVLTLRAMRDQSELAAVSHEGSRQLAVATGLLPRTVEVPQWVQFGVGAFFESPKEAYWPGTGAPSWKYLPRFKNWSQAQKLDPPDQALKQVVMDGYFQQADSTQSPADQLKARAMTWSLTYFLMQRKLDGVGRYFHELDQLPRDMAVDPNVLWGCFARAFDLVDATNPAEVNQAKMRTLANDWYAEINGIPLEFDEAKNELLRQYYEKLNRRRGGTGTTPGTTPPKTP